MSRQRLPRLLLFRFSPGHLSFSLMKKPYTEKDLEECRTRNDWQ